jgi:hypothetical protein
MLAMSTQPDKGRQPKLVVLGVALVVGCAAIGAELARRGSHVERYLELAVAVPAGSPITAGELTTAAMSAPSNLSPIPASDLGAVAGARATEPLVKGTLLVASDLTVSGQPGGGTALVGTSLQPDQAPASLAVGDAVVVVDSASTTGGASTSPAVSSVSGGGRRGARIDVLGRGTVFSLLSGSASGTLDVTIAVPASQASAIATASASGSLSLVQVAETAARTSR